MNTHFLLSSLMHNELRIEGGSGLERVPFLSEKDLPRKETTAGERDSITSAEEQMSSSSTTDGAVTGEDTGKLSTLMALGFNEMQARAALAQAGGDAEMAATLLWSGMEP